MTEAEAAAIHEALGRHESKLDAGQHAFAAIRAELGTLNERTKDLVPKKPDYLKIAAFALSVIIVVLGGWWKLSQLLGDRPTKDEIRRDEAEMRILQEQQGKEIREIHDQQIEQSATLKMLQGSADKTNQQLDKLLDARRNGTP